MTISEFIIVAPPYHHNSAGVVALHRLCDGLNKAGASARMVFYFYKNGALEYLFNPLDPQFYSADLNYGAKCSDESYAKILELGVVVYPEVVNGNPLKAANIVRYVLNREGFVDRNKMNEGPNDFILTYSPIFHSNPDFTLIQVLQSEEMLNMPMPVSQRSLDLTWVGKGRKYRECSKVPNTVMINSSWPETKDEFNLLLRNTNMIYSWDCLSNVNFDAVLCGAIPVILQWQPFTSIEIDNFGYGPFPRASLKIDVKGNVSIEISRDQFIEQRSVMIENMKILKGNWVTRVGEFWQSANAHFV